MYCSQEILLALSIDCSLTYFKNNLNIRGAVMELFKDKVAIVTGGGSGIGKGIAIELASRRSRIIVADINLKGSKDTVAAIQSKGDSQ
jgi:hypothetical protein